MIKFRTVAGTKYFESIWCLLRNQKGFLREVMTKLLDKRDWVKRDLLGVGGHLFHVEKSVPHSPFPQI